MLTRAREVVTKTLKETAYFGVNPQLSNTWSAAAIWDFYLSLPGDSVDQWNAICHQRAENDGFDGLFGPVAAVRPTRLGLLVGFAYSGVSASCSITSELLEELETQFVRFHIGRRERKSRPESTVKKSFARVGVAAFFRHALGFFGAHKVDARNNP